MAPNEAGSVRNSVAWVRSRKVLGCPESGVFPCRERMDAVEWAEKEGELEKKGCHALARDGLCHLSARNDYHVLR